MGKIKRNTCPCEKKLLKNKKRYCKNHNILIQSSIAKKKTSESRVLYLQDDVLSNINPFLKSIISFSYLNLDFYQKTFNVFYAIENTQEIETISEFYFTETYDIKELNQTQKNNHKKALQVVADFIDCKIDEVDTIEKADIVVTNFDTFQDWTYTATSPYEMDVFSVLENRAYLFYNGLYDEDNTEPGSFWFMTYMASFLKILGFALPETNENQSEIIPACTNECGKNNNGLFEMNTVLNTVLSSRFTELPYVNLKTEIDWESYSFPRTLMPLDLQALRILFNIDQVSPEYSKHINTNLLDGVTQTFVGDLKLYLRPLADKYQNFILNLDSYNANPIADSRTISSSLSRVADSLLGVNILDKYSTINEVMLGYSKNFIYASKLTNNVKIKVADGNVEQVNIYLPFTQKDYSYEEKDELISIISLKTGKGIMFDFNGFDEVELNIEFSSNKVELENPEEPDVPEEQEEPEESEESEYLEETEEQDEPEEPEESEKKRGNAILDNLKEEHYREILDSFKKSGRLNGLSGRALMDEVNKFAVDYITNKFRSKIEGKPIPHLSKMLEKNELKKR